MLIIPIACAALPHARTLGRYFPIAAAVIAAGLLCSRFLSDRASGFADGIGSSPAARATLGARFVTGIVLVLLQLAIFYAAVRFVV